MQTVSEESPVHLDALVVSRKDQLQRINDAGLVAQGRVFLLSLEPIKQQIGARWPHRSETVWEGVERALAKSMPPPDVFIRIHDTAVLVAVASTDSYEAQIRCIEVLRSLLTFFLGRTIDADIAMSRISSIQDGALSTEPVDLATLPTRNLEPLNKAVARRPEDWTPPLTERRIAGTITLSHYGDADYAIDVVPVWRLDQETISSYAIRLRLPGVIERLSDLDQEALAGLVVDYLIPILEDYRREGGTFALIVPLPFSVLSARRPRLAILDRCAPLKKIMRSAVIAEISGLHAGVPPGLIRETVSMISPFVRVVTAAVSTPTDVSAVYREAAFHGVAVSWRRGRSGTLSAVLKAARRRTVNLVVHGVPTGTGMDELRCHHATHVTYDEAGLP